MSFLKKVLAKNNKFPDEFEGVKIVERPKEDFGKQGSGGGVGMHYLDEKSDLTDDSIEFHRLIDDALKDNAKTLYIYNQGSTKSRPHLYLIKSSADESNAATRMEIISALSDVQEMLDRKQIDRAIAAIDDIKGML